MPVRPFPLLRRRWARPRAHHRHPRISNCGLCRAGNLRCSHSRGADGRRGLGSGCCLGRRCHFRRPTMARRGGYPLSRVPLSAIFGRGQAPRHRRPTPPLATCRPHYRRDQTALRLPRECRPSSPPRFPRSRQRTGRHGLQACGRPLYCGGGRCAPPARAAVHPRHPRRRRVGRPRAPALGPGRVAETGRR